MAKNAEIPDFKIAWGITGAGHFLKSCLDILRDLNHADVFISNAGKEVLTNYDLLEALKKSDHHVFSDTNASSRSVTKLYMGHYQAVVIAPVTSNSISKMVNGISDNLITNLFAHAGKCQLPILLLPCDVQSQMDSLTPQGDPVQVHVREIDLENINRLANWSGVTVAHNPKELETQLHSFLR